jgi:hypothetical protein
MYGEREAIIMGDVDLERACLAVVNAALGKPLSETEVRDCLTMPSTRVRVRKALRSLSATKQVIEVRFDRLSRHTYCSVRKY